VGAAARRPTTTRRGRTETAVVLRSRDAIAAVTLRLPGRGKAVRQLASAGATAYATTLAARVNRVRSMTAWDRVLEGIGADGSVTRQLALRAFAIVYGPLPGVKRPRGPLGGPDSGTSAINLVRSVWGQLTPAQQAAIHRILGVQRDPGLPPLARAAGEDPQLEAMAKDYLDWYHGKMPSVPVPIMKVYTTDEEIGPPADTSPTNVSDGSKHCETRIPPSTMAWLGTDKFAKKFDYVLAHEAFHCISYNMYNAYSEGTPVPGQWLADGLATWGGIQATGFVDFPLDGVAYPKYLWDSSTPLFQRTYDAVGFFGRIEEFGGAENLWAKIPALFADLDPVKQYAVAGGTQPGFLEGWASGRWRIGAAGPSWTQLKPYWLSPNLILTPAATITVSAFVDGDPYTLQEYVVVGDAKRPLVEIRGYEGYLRAGTIGQDFGLIGDENADNGWFCFADSCACPAGSVGSVPPHRPVGAKVLALALTGGPDAGEGVVYYHSVEEFCGGAPVPPTACPGRHRPLAAPSLGTSPASRLTRLDEPCEAGPTPPTALSIDSQDPRYPGRAINTPGQCFVSSPRDDGTRAWVLNFDGFQIAVPVFTGAGQYVFPGALARGPLSPYANASTGGVGPWHTLAVPLGGAGSFTVADGLRSGTVSATLWAPGDPPLAKPLTVSGTWSCDVQGGPFPGLPIGLS
jgi:hypothetical protein